MCDVTEKLDSKSPGITTVAFTPHCKKMKTRVCSQHYLSNYCKPKTSSDTGKKKKQKNNTWHAIRFLPASAKQLLQSPYILPFAKTIFPHLLQHLFH